MVSFLIDQRVEADLLQSTLISFISIIINWIGFYLGNKNSFATEISSSFFFFKYYKVVSVLIFVAKSFKFDDFNIDLFIYLENSNEY